MEVRSSKLKLSPFPGLSISYKIFVFLLYAELYTNTRFLTIRDQPVVPVGCYLHDQIKTAITAHWLWMQDTFKV